MGRLAASIQRVESIRLYPRKVRENLEAGSIPVGRAVAEFLG